MKKVITIVGVTLASCVGAYANDPSSPSGEFNLTTTVTNPANAFGYVLTTGVTGISADHFPSTTVQTIANLATETVQFYLCAVTKDNSTRNATYSMHAENTSKGTLDQAITGTPQFKLWSTGTTPIVYTPTTAHTFPLVLTAASHTGTTPLATGQTSGIWNGVGMTGAQILAVVNTTAACKANGYAMSFTRAAVSYPDGVYTGKVKFTTVIS